MKSEAKYIWFSDGDASRNPYAAFRKTFEINDKTEIKNAEFNIFADTNYKLYVNGIFAGFGPVRFDPRFPQFDTYDLTPYLQNGNNVIAVLANFHGHKTFKNVPKIAAIIAWGNISDIDLSTNGKNWKCERYTAYSRYTPKLSFALNAQIFYDQAKFDENWINPDYDDREWHNAIELKNQDCFGELRPREIPFMSMKDVPVKTKTRVLPLKRDEDLYSFHIELPYTLDVTNLQTEYKDTVEWRTHIHSLCEQNITAAVLYETISVNNIVCEPKFEDESKPLRYNFVMHLNEGWNEVSGSVKIYQDIYDCYLALQKNKDLILSADKNKESRKLFKYTKITRKDAETEWAYSTDADRAESPCREASWDTYCDSIESIDPDKLNGFTFKKSLYPDGFTLIFDMEYMRLVFPQFIFKGIKGATIDLLYNDRYMSDNKHIRQQSWIPLGDRLVCDYNSGVIDWSPVQPRGFKYLNITVRNTSDDVTLEKIDFISANYPVEERGRFECSDPALNNIWKMCALTQKTNMEDAFDDCVNRERGLYALDTLIQYHVNLACYGDHKLMKRSLELYAQSIHPNGMYRCLYPNTGDYILPDFCLYIVEGFYSYYLYTEDKKLIETWWDTIITNLNVFNRLSDEREDYLLCADPPDKSNPNDRRTGHLGDGGCTNNKGINCIFTCLYLIALRGAYFLAGAIDKTDDANNMKKRIDVLEKSIQKFWNEEKGLFADNLDMKDFSPHASLFAIRAGVVANKNGKFDKLDIIQKSLEPMLTPFFKNGYDPSKGAAFTTSYGYYMFDSLYKAGMYKTAENCMKEGWGWFLAKGLKTTPEHFSLAESQCHAWTSSPAYIMSRYILGVNFDISTGLNCVIIDVKTDSIKWAKGTFPHPSGDIEISWHKDGGTGKIIYDKISAPDGVDVEIRRT
ncbi:MAG: hypothetical protein FWD71_05815 [Oscillospiraceae bacterium]|nr:hypothetical protein [Oscillospiraceae bacterium]